MLTLKSWKGVLLGGGILVAGLFGGSAPAAAEGGGNKKESRPIVEESQVYFGKVATCRAPAVVDGSKVYKAIPEYRRIVEQGLTDKDAEYTILLVKATRKFRAAVEATAVEAGKDLVANVGSVKWEGHEIPDLTDATLKKLEEQAKGN